VTDENHAPAHRINDASGRSNVILEGGLRRLGDTHLIAVLLQDLGNSHPAGSIGERTMDKNDILG
jgi:hypothetical protein